MKLFKKENLKYIVIIILVLIGIVMCLWASRIMNHTEIQEHHEIIKDALRDGRRAGKTQWIIGLVALVIGYIFTFFPKNLRRS